MSKLWTVEVELTYTLVVYAPTHADARTAALDNYRDAVDPAEWVNEQELRPGDSIPEGWENSEPYGKYDDDSLAEDMGMDALPGFASVRHMLEWMAERDRAHPPRCDHTTEMFDDASTQVTNDRRDEGRKA
jgi:hypothetical protein